MTAAGWACFIALLAIDTLFIIVFLDYNGAIELSFIVIGNTSIDYGEPDMTTFQWVYFCIMIVCNVVVTLIIFSLAGAFGKRLLTKRALAAAMAPSRAAPLGHHGRDGAASVLPSERAGDPARHGRAHHREDRVPHAV